MLPSMLWNCFVKYLRLTRKETIVKKHINHFKSQCGCLNLFSYQLDIWSFNAWKLENKLIDFYSLLRENQDWAM